MWNMIHFLEMLDKQETFYAPLLITEFEKVTSIWNDRRKIDI